jgi:hypothetical protein
MDDLSTLGKRLKWLRENRLKHRSTRETERYLLELPEAERPDQTSYQTLRRYEEGGRNPSVRFVEAMARLGGVRFEWLANGVGSPDEAETGQWDARELWAEVAAQDATWVDRMLEDLDRPDEIRRFHSHVGIGSRVATVVYNAERRAPSRDELFKILHKIRKWAAEAEDAVNELHQKLRDRDRPADDESGS